MKLRAFASGFSSDSVRRRPSEPRILNQAAFGLERVRDARVDLGDLVLVVVRVVGCNKVLRVELRLREAGAEVEARALAQVVRVAARDAHVVDVDVVGNSSVSHSRILQLAVDVVEADRPFTAEGVEDRAEMEAIAFGTVRRIDVVERAFRTEQSDLTSCP